MKYNYNNIINENKNKLIAKGKGNSIRIRSICFPRFPHYLAYFVADFRCKFSVESRTVRRVTLLDVCNLYIIRM